VGTLTVVEWAAVAGIFVVVAWEASGEANVCEKVVPVGDTGGDDVAWTFLGNGLGAVTRAILAYGFLGGPVGRGGGGGREVGMVWRTLAAVALRVSSLGVDLGRLLITELLEASLAARIDEREGIVKRFGGSDILGLQDWSLVCRIGLVSIVTRGWDWPLRRREGAARCRRLGSDNR